MRIEMSRGGNKPQSSLMKETRPLLKTTSSLVSEGSMGSTAVSTTPTTATVDWIRNAWIIQILVGVAVIGLAIWQNSDESKYIPVKMETTEEILNGKICTRVFANVLSFSADEEGALQCCSASDPALTGPCSASTRSLPLEKRLTNFPEAWVFPLLPWLYRLIWDTMEQSTSTNTAAVPRGRVFVRALQRLALYVCIMLFRGWVLYVGLNTIEARLLSVELMPADNDLCWYKAFLRNGLSAAPSCYGRMFDFSDHVVFYFVQVLAIVWTEYLDALSTTTSSGGTSHRGIGLIILSAMVAYLHLLVYSGVYKTARWFHTGSEIIVGWLISLLVTLPVALWQSTMTSPITKMRSRRLA